MIRDDNQKHVVFINFVNNVLLKILLCQIKSVYALFLLDINIIFIRR